MIQRRRVISIVAAVAVAATGFGLAACGDDSTPSTGGSGLPQGSEAVTLDPAKFSTTIDNPYWPMTPGSRWVY